MSRLSKYYFDGQFEPYYDIISDYASSSACFSPGDTMNRFGSRLDMIFYIKSGIFKVVALTDSGSEMTLAFYGHGSLYPPKRKSFDFSIESFIRFKAVTPVEALMIPVQKVGQMFSEHPEIALCAVDSRTLELNLQTARLIQTAISVKCKVCNFLYLFCVDLDNVQLPLSQQDVASMTGSSRVQVARVYQSLRDEGIIEIGHRSVKILDTDALYKNCTRLLVP